MFCDSIKVWHKGSYKLKIKKSSYFTLKSIEDKVFFLMAKEERLLGKDGANATRYDCFLV